MRNLTEKTSEQYLEHLFNQWCKGQVERVKKAKDYAFVHFYNRAAAEMAKVYSGMYYICIDTTQLHGAYILRPVSKLVA